MTMMRLFYILASFMISNVLCDKEYDLPVIPAALPAVSAIEDGYSKLIPRNIWVAVKNRADELPGHLPKFFDRNPLWKKNICDNICKETFMNETFAGTSVQWAFFAINPIIGASRADIWRYSVLYTYGGMYMDDDSDIGTPLDEVVLPSDHLIMSEEGASSLGDCYMQNFSLSDKYATVHYPNASLAKHFHSFDNSTGMPKFFHGNTLINWALFVKPRHPLFLLTLTNIVHIIKAEYLRRSVVVMTRWDHRWKHVFCTTGFTLTYTLRKMLLDNAPDLLVPRIEVNNFAIYRGRVKAIWTGADPSHYMKLMRGKNSVHLLREHAPVTLESTLEYLDGKVVMGDAGKEIYLVTNATRRPFPDFETFVKMNFDLNQVKHLKDSVLTLIPLGPDVPSLMK